VNAAARQERDTFLAEEPGSGVRGVASVGILGEGADEPPGDSLVQRRQQKRQRRLGDAGTSRQRLSERIEPLVGDELVDE
jgi:hypothetical protein